METFEANVQYNDWKGSAAADDADINELWSWLRNEGDLAEAERVSAFTCYNGRSDGISLRVYVLEGDFDSAHEYVRSSDVVKFKRCIDKELTFEQFFKLFKRFEIAMCQRGSELHGKYFSV